MVTDGAYKRLQELKISTIMLPQLLLVHVGGRIKTYVNPSLDSRNMPGWCLPLPAQRHRSRQLARQPDLKPSDLSRFVYILPLAANKPHKPLLSIPCGRACHLQQARRRAMSLLRRVAQLLVALVASEDSRQTVGILKLASAMYVNCPSQRFDSTAPSAILVGPSEVPKL